MSSIGVERGITLLRLPSIYQSDYQEVGKEEDNMLRTYYFLDILCPVGGSNTKISHQLFKSCSGSSTIQQICITYYNFHLSLTLQYHWMPSETPVRLFVFHKRHNWNFMVRPFLQQKDARFIGTIKLSSLSLWKKILPVAKWDTCDIVFVFPRWL